MASRRMMKFSTFLTAGGEHIAAWRHPEVELTTRAEIAHYVNAARILERGLFDMILIGDVAPSSNEPVEVLSRGPGYDKLDPLMMLAALAMTTERIGLAPTISTTYNEPFHIARKLASLDHISHGRAGWNIVTTMNATDSLNFSQDRHAAHDDRYARAEEAVDVVCGLWASWDEDAFIRDKASGIYFKPEGLHVLHHKGAHFSVRGPLDIIPPPQGRPVLIQAGSSDIGRELGARVADIIFSTQQSMQAAMTFARDVRERAGKYGRGAEEVAVLMAVVPVVGGTDAEARAKFDEIQALVHPVVALPQLASSLGGIDLSVYPLDEPLPAELPAGNGMISRRAGILELAQREGLTLRQLAVRVAGTRGHWTLIGTPEMIADRLEEWFLNRAADGFLLVPAILPGGFEDFVSSVIPELQRRSLFRTAYEGTTLRENLELPLRPYRRGRTADASNGAPASFSPSFPETNG